MSKKIITLALLLASVTLLAGCSLKKKDDGKKSPVKDEVKVNTNTDVVKDQELEGIKLTNTSVVTKNGLSTIVTSVTNTTNKDYKLDEYSIIFKDEEGKVIITLPGYVGDVIKAGETRTINSSVDIDLSNAKSVEYKVKK